MIKQAVHPSGDIITFNSQGHTYSSKQYPKQKFTSGTKFLAKFFNEFDAERISKNYAAKHSMEQQDVLAMWKRKGDIGRETFFCKLYHGQAHAIDSDAVSR